MLEYVGEEFKIAIISMFKTALKIIIQNGWTDRKSEYISKNSKNESNGNSRTEKYYIWKENFSELEDIAKELPHLNNKDKNLRTKVQW